jgi:tetratricopeptide (TPR) repeat protein
VFRSLAILLGFVFPCLTARPATVLVLQFHNNSQYSDLNWVGESIAETLTTEFAGANQIAVDRASRAEAIRRLALRADGDFTRATLLRLGQTVGADYLCFGGFEISVQEPHAPLKDSSIRISAQFVDLRKFHDGPEISEAGRLSELSRLQEHLAFESLKYLDPKIERKADEFMAPQKSVRLDVEESYVRGLLTTNREQKQKWFLQAEALDGKFPGALFELGKISLEQKQYAQAIEWLRRIGPADPNYPEARFKMGLAAYATGDYSGAAGYFREVAKTYPLSEVYNNLGAAENQLNQPSAADDFRRALDGDSNSPVYLFNLGTALLKANDYDGAAKRFEEVLARDPNDIEARALLDTAKRRDPSAVQPKNSGQRLKSTFNETAFRQLKAVLQPEPGH